MPRVALVNPQIVTSRFQAGFATTDDIVIRHALAQLAPILRAAGHEVALVDLRLLAGWDDYDRTLTGIRPDWICLSAHTCEREPAFTAIARSRAALPAARIVAGGIDATLAPADWRAAGADFVLQGEGEITLARLLEAPGSFPPVFYGDTPELDRLPFADRTLWPDHVERTRHSILNFTAPLPFVDVVAQRGCPWQCKFCCGPGEQNLYTRPVGPDRRSFSFRVRSPDHVCDELERLDRAYAYRSIVFHDDQFIVRPKWVEAWCDTLERRFPGRRTPFWAAVRADVICRHAGSGDLMERLVASGLHTISIGFESFSDELLGWMKKGTTAEQNYRAAEICHKLGLEIYGNFMFGLPREDGRWRLEDDRKTLDAIRRIRPRTASMSFFTPTPGAPFYDWFAASGLMIAHDAAALGQRNPDAGKLRGVDYRTLSRLIADVRDEIGSPPARGWRRVAKAVLRPMGLLPAARRVRDQVTRLAGRRPGQAA